MRNLIKNRFYILFACFIINMCLGIIYTWSIFKNTLIVDYGWSNTLASLPYTTAIFALSITLLLAGALQDKIGPKLILTIGTVLVGLGLILSMLAETPLTLSFTFGICTGSGIGFCYACLNPTAMKWFHFSQKGMVNGLLAAGFAVSAVFLAPMISSLITTVHLQDTFLIIGVVILCISVPLAITVDNPKETLDIGKTRNADQDRTELPRAEVTWRSMIKSPRFYALWIMYFIASSIGLMIIANITTIASIQAGITNAVYLVVIFAIFNAVGRLLAGILSDKIGCIETLILSFAIQSINVMCFNSYANSSELVIGIAIAGIGYGSLLSVFPSATVEYFGINNFGGNYGILFTAWGIGGVVGPTLTAYIVDMTNSYDLAYTIGSLLLVSISLVAVYIKYTDKRTSKEEVACSMCEYPK